MRFKTFIALAQSNPLAIEEDAVEAIQQKANTYNKIEHRLDKFAYAMAVTTPLALVLASVAVMVFKYRDAFTTFLIIGTPIFLLVATCLLLIPIETQKPHRNDALAWAQPLAEMEGDECTEVLHLCHASPGARAFRDRVLRDSRPLRMMHLERMRRIVHNEQEESRAQERSRACRAAHGLVFDTNDGVVAPRSSMGGAPLVALGALALATLVAKR